MASDDDRAEDGIRADDPSADLVPYDRADAEPVPPEPPPDEPPVEETRPAVEETRPAVEAAPQGMIPARAHRRRAVERVAVRFIATGGIIGIGVALAAILGSNNVAAWTIGLVVAVVSVVLAAILWSSREM